MKAQIFNRNFFLLLLALFTGGLRLNAQFEESLQTPGPGFAEDAWDGKQLGTTDHFIMLSNTSAFGASRIVLTELNAAGAVLNHAIIFDGANPGHPYLGRAIEIDYTPAGVPIGLFITGSRGAAAAGGATQLIVFRAALAGAGLPFGAVTWMRYLPNTVGGAITYDEIGMSIERQTNGDVIAIGKSKEIATSTGRMIGLRYTAGGAYVWGNRYNPTVAGTGFFPAESCNGTLTIAGAATAVVAVTGQYILPGGGRTFGSCINATTGAEVWRRYYLSNRTFDEGIDIVQNPANKKFMIVGRAATAPTEDLWVLNVTGTTGALPAGGSTVYSMPGSSLVGRDVNMATMTTKAAISGYYRYTDAAGVAQTDAFLMRIPWTNFATPDWTKTYFASLPISNGSESIVPVVAAGAAVPGYFITTNAKPNAFPVTGSHPLYVDALGLHPYAADCPIPNITPAKLATGQNVNLAKNKTAVDCPAWQIQFQQQPVAIAACDGVLPPPIGNGSDDRAAFSPSQTNRDLKVSPNPVFAGQDFQVEIQAGNSGKATAMLFDLSGKQVWANAFDLEYSENERVLDVPTTGLSAGTFILRVQTLEGVKTARVVVNR